MECGILGGGGRGGADLLAGEGDFAGLGGDAMGCFFGNAFDCFGDLEAAAVGCEVGFFFFYVEVFGVFTDDDEVDLFLGGGDGFYGADVGVEIELFAECDDGGGVAGDFFCGGGDGAEEGGVAFRA